MKTLLRWIVRTVLGLLALLVLLVAVLFAANWRDEALTPEAQHLLAPPEPSDAPNAYYVLLGIDAPDDEDAAAAGRRVLAELDRQYRENPARTDYSRWPQSKTMCLGLFDSKCAWSTLRCPQKGADCVAHYLSEKICVQKFMAEQTLLLQRYRQFSEIPVYAEPPLHSAAEPLPSYQALILAAEVRLADAVFAFDEGHFQAGANTLMQEIRVHRRFLANSATLLSKMIGLALLRRDYEVLGNCLEHWPALAQQAELAEAWQPLREPEYGLGKSIEFEAAFAASVLRSTIQVQKNYRIDQFLKKAVETEIEANSRLAGIPWYETLLSYFALPNATLNQKARWSLEDARDIEGDAATVDARRQAHAARRAKELRPSASRYIRNPGGKTLLAFGDAPFFDYAERMYDLDGAIRLIALQAALRRDSVPQSQVADYVQHAAPALRNPYNGQPMRWDAAASTLSFEGRQPNIFNPDAAPKTFSIRLKFKS